MKITYVTLRIATILLLLLCWYISDLDDLVIELLCYIIPFGCSLRLLWHIFCQVEIVVLELHREAFDISNWVIRVMCFWSFSRLSQLLFHYCFFGILTFQCATGSKLFVASFGNVNSWIWFVSILNDQQIVFAWPIRQLVIQIHLLLFLLDDFALLTKSVEEILLLHFSDFAFLYNSCYCLKLLILLILLFKDTIDFHDIELATFFTNWSKLLLILVLTKSICWNKNDDHLIIVRLGLTCILSTILLI